MEIVEEQQEKIIKPRFSMDLMIFGNINELNKLIDTHAVEVERGQKEHMADWKAGLWQLYRNIGSFITDPNKIAAIEEAFRMLDNLVNPIQGTMPESVSGIIATYGILRDLNSMLYEERNNTFIKIKRQMSDIDKLVDSEFGFLPKKEREEVKLRLEEQRAPSDR